MVIAGWVVPWPRDPYERWCTAAHFVILIMQCFVPRLFLAPRPAVSSNRRLIVRGSGMRVPNQVRRRFVIHPFAAPVGMDHSGRLRGSLAVSSLSTFNLLVCVFFSAVSLVYYFFSAVVRHISDDDSTVILLFYFLFIFSSPNSDFDRRVSNTPVACRQPKITVTDRFSNISVSLTRIYIYVQIKKTFLHPPSVSLLFRLFLLL